MSASTESERQPAKPGGGRRLYLDTPVTVPGVGVVRDDLWAGRYLKTIRT